MAPTLLSAGLLLASLAMTVPTALGAAVGGDSTIVTLDSKGRLPDRLSFLASMDDAGRYVVYWSFAHDLNTGSVPACGPVPPDSLCTGVYLFDARDGSTRLVAGHAARTSTPLISADGSTVIFSADSDILPEDDNGLTDLYAYKVAEGTLELVTRTSDGQLVRPEPGVASRGAGEDRASISGDGRFVLFDSNSTTVVPDDTNKARDLFVRDRLLGTTERVTLAADGGEIAGHSRTNVVQAMSADGRYVVYWTDALNVVPGLDPECRRTWFFQDDTACPHVYLFDRATRTTRILDVGPDGAPSKSGATLPTVSPDGRYAAFMSGSPDLPGANGIEQLYLVHLATGSLELLSANDRGEPGAGRESWMAHFSADGRYVSFRSAATNLDVDSPTTGELTYVRDLEDRRTFRIGSPDLEGMMLTGQVAGAGLDRLLLSAWPADSHPHYADTRMVVVIAENVRILEDEAGRPTGRDVPPPGHPESISVSVGDDSNDLADQSESVRQERTAPSPALAAIAAIAGLIAWSCRGKRPAITGRHRSR